MRAVVLVLFLTALFSHEPAQAVDCFDGGRYVPCSLNEERPRGAASAGSAVNILSKWTSEKFDPQSFNYFDLVIASSCAVDANPLRVLAEEFIKSAKNYGFARENRTITVNLSIKNMALGAADQEIATVPLVDFKTDKDGGVLNARCERLLVKNLFIQQDLRLEFTLRASEANYVVDEKLLATVRFVGALAPYIGPILQLGQSFAPKAQARSKEVEAVAGDVNTYLETFKVQKTGAEPVQLLQTMKSVTFELPGGAKFIISKEPKAYVLFSKLENLGNANISGAFLNQTGLDLAGLVNAVVPDPIQFVSTDVNVVINACRRLFTRLTNALDAGSSKRFLTPNEALIVKWWVLSNNKPLPELTRNNCVDSDDVKKYARWGLDTAFLTPTSSKSGPPDTTTSGNKPAFEKLDAFLTSFFTDLQKAQNEARLLAKAQLDKESAEKLAEERVFRIADYISPRANVRSASGPLIFESAQDVADGYAVASNLIIRTSVERFGCYRRTEGDLRQAGIEAEALFLTKQDARLLLVNALIGPAMGGKYAYVISKIVTEEASPATLRAVQSRFENGCGTWTPWAR